MTDEKKQQIVVGISVAALVIALLGMGSAVYFFRQSRTRPPEEQTDVPKGEIADDQSVLDAVRKLILLPNEEPRIVTIANVEELKTSQLFFQDAQNGDKLIIFTDAKKAVVYRPGEHIIVNVAPIVIGSDTPSTPSAETPSGAIQGQPVKIALRNGTGIAGLTKKLEDALKTSIPDAVITEKDNAKRTSYEKTILIVLNDRMDKSIVQKIVNDLSLSIEKLPSDEPKPAADFLIIAGKDRK